VTRAVINFPIDISCAIPIMEKIIDGYVYNTEVPVAAFRYKNWSVVIHRDEIVINNAENEASATEVINFLKDIINNTDEITGEARNH